MNSGLAVPEEEPGEKTNPHNGKSQIDMPSVQHRCRHDRAQGGQDQQEGSPALRQFLLFDHSRFSSRLSDAHSASHQRFFPALSSRQLSTQVDNLPYMICMPGTTHENLEPAIVPFTSVMRGPFESGPLPGWTPGPSGLFRRSWAGPFIPRKADNSPPSGKVKDSLQRAEQHGPSGSFGGFPCKNRCRNFLARTGL